MAEFYLDENVAERLSDELEARSHDSVSTNALGHKGASDPERLTYAVDLNRIFVTHNESDFTMLHEAWHRWSRRWNVSEHAEHFGIIVVRQAIGLTVEETAVRISE